MKIYLVRHGLCRHNMPNPSGVIPDPFGSAYDAYDRFSLVPQGILQAELTGWRLRSVDFAAAYSSYLIRTVQTASGILKFQNKLKTLSLHAELSEISDFAEGNFPFLPTEIYEKVWHKIEPPTDPTVTGLTRSPVPETDEIIMNRARHFAEYLIGKHKGTNDSILVVSHENLLGRFLIPCLMHTTAQDAHPMNYAQGNCAVTVIEIDENGTLRLLVLNSVDHLGDVNMYRQY